MQIYIIFMIKSYRDGATILLFEILFILAQSLEIS
jgi:hypothetical protein